MCGFVGIFGEIDECDVSRALSEIKHRGPDNKSIKNSSDWLVGFSRLSILDLSLKGMQPFENDECVVYLNGEVYNYIELCSEHNSEFRPLTSSDVEIVPFLYKKYGIEFLQKINGMFAMILIDKRQNTKYLIKDRFGEKPLFYTKNKNRIFFSSEIKAIKKITPLNPDAGQVLINLACYGVTPPNTLYKEVFALPPGSFLKVDKNLTTKLFKWYEPKNDKNRNKFNLNELQNIFENSISLRARADVPICVFLSGGLDSMLIAATLKKQSIKFSALTVHIPGKESWDSDTDIVNPPRFCLEKGVRQISTRIDYDYWNKNILKIVSHYDEVFVDSGNLVFYALGELAKKNQIKVALTGVGGDELFGGYPWQDRLLKWGRWGASLGDNGAIFEKTLESLCFAIPRCKTRELVLRCLQVAFFPGLYHLTSLGGGLVEDILVSETNARDLIRSLAQQEFNYNKLPNFMDWENKVNLLNFKNIIPFQNFKADMGTMAFSVENRSPFLDYRIVEMMINLPQKEKLKNGKKGILKNLGSAILPAYILQAKKSGPTMPINQWFQGSKMKMLQEFMRQSKNEVGDFMGGTFADYWCGKKPDWENRRFSLKMFFIIHLILWIKENVTAETPANQETFENLVSKSNK